MLLIISGQGNLPGVKLGDALEGIDLYNRFVGAKSQNAWKSECVAAFVALRLLNVVESHFHDYPGLNNSARAEIFDGVLQEVFCTGLDFGVSEPRIGFPNGQELVAVAY